MYVGVRTRQVKGSREGEMDGCTGLSSPLWLEDVTPLKARAGYGGVDRTAFFKSFEVEGNQEY